MTSAKLIHYVGLESDGRDTPSLLLRSPAPSVLTPTRHARRRSSLAPTSKHNLLLWLPGFEASQVNFKDDQTMGSALQDLVFDAETKSALHIEMAKKILFVKRGEKLRKA